MRLFARTRIAIIIAVVALSSAAGSRAFPWGHGSTTILIPDGTEVRVRLAQTIGSASAVENQRVALEAAADVVIDGVTVIRSGAVASGTIVRAEHRKSFGRRGKLDLTIDRVEAVNGDQIPLRIQRALRGRDKYGKAGVITLLFGPFGFFVKGVDIEVPAGTEYTLYIEGDRRVRLAGGIS